MQVNTQALPRSTKMGWLRALQDRHDSWPDSSLLQAETKYSKCCHIETLRTERPGSCDHAAEKIGIDIRNSVGEPKPLDHHEAPKRPFCNEELNDDALPFISSQEVMSKRARRVGQFDQEGRRCDEELWIVVDSIVYDCSDFVYDHPGGQQVIESFAGEDCSWQFWRFHGKNEMLQYGRALRVGRTAGIKNKFPEVSRYVGLSRIGHDEW